jgi:hypothetical protein
MYVYINDCSSIAREIWSSLHGLGFNKCVKVKEVDNSTPLNILKPPEHTCNVMRLLRTSILIITALRALNKSKFLSSN